MTAYFIRPFLDLLSLGGLKVMPVSTGSSSLYTLKSFLIAQASPFSDSVSNFLNCLLSFRDYSGRDLKWNPHIHCHLSEGGCSDNGFWRKISHFNYTYLCNAFRTALLSEMESRIGPSFNKIKSCCYREHKDGFYVYAKPNACDPKTAIKYIGRYLGRQVIAASRIDRYDGDLVTFHYNRHEDKKYVEETIPVMEFIQRLIWHIPEKHFKMIRYGDIYARRRELDKKLRRTISREKHPVYRNFNQWRASILSSFGYAPLKCECGTTMLFLELYHSHKRVSLKEMYENAMSRSRGKRSSA